MHVLQPGDSAPALMLPTVNQAGTVSLADFRANGRSVLIAFMRGLHCPFSPRQISNLMSMKERLEAQGADIVVVVNTTLERAKIYFQYWPTQIIVAADPGVESHRSFGLGETAILPDDTDPSMLKWPHTATMAEVLKHSVTGHPELQNPT
jgi:peroxiredoxin